MTAVAAQSSHMIELAGEYNIVRYFALSVVKFDYRRLSDRTDSPGRQNI